MGLEDMFSGCKKIIVLVALSALLAGFIGDFITCITWWNRIQPWFAHGYKEGKTVYQCILACWVLSLVGAIATAFFLIATLCLKSVCGSITGNKVAFFICFILVGGISIGSIISGGYGSSYALKNPGEDDDENQRCSKYLSSGMAGVSAWILKHLDKSKDWTEWTLNAVKHKAGYYCRDVGAPVMTFVLVQCCAIILWVVILLCALIC